MQLLMSSTTSTTEFISVTSNKTSVNQCNLSPMATQYVQDESVAFSINAERKGKFADLPSDIFLELVHCLNNTDHVCLGLVSYRFHALVLTATGRRKLSELCLYRPFDRGQTIVERLTSWMPPGYVLCSAHHCKFIKGGDKGAICSECRSMIEEDVVGRFWCCGRHGSKPCARKASFESD